MEAKRDSGPGTRALPWHQRYKPAASRRAHLTAAGVMWSCVGTALVIVGAVWTMRSAGRWLWLALALAVVVGAAKGLAVLRRAARRNVTRIESRGDGTCLGGFLGLRGWVLVAIMMTGGRLLRASSIPRWVLGPLYVAIGIALWVGSVEIWRAQRATKSAGTRGLGR